MSAAISAARTELDRAEGAAGDLERIERLGQALAHVTTALNEAMAATVVRGGSMRSVAKAAGMAPNSVRPRIAESQVLRPYTEDGVLDADGIVLARLAARAPLRFSARRSIISGNPQEDS